MLTKELRQNEAGEQVEVYVDEQGNVVDNPTPEQIGETDYEAEVQKRGAKAVMLENERKAKEVADLKARLAQFEEQDRQAKAKIDNERKQQEPQAEQTFRERMRNLGKTDAEIDVMIDYQRTKAQETSRLTVNSMKDATLEGIITAKKNSADEFEREFIGKYENEFREELKKRPVEWWNDAECQGAAITAAIRKDPKKVFAKAEPKKPEDAGDLPADTGNTPKSAKPSNSEFSVDEVARYARENHMVVETPEDRKKIAYQMSLEKKVKDKEAKLAKEREKEERDHRALYNR